MKNDIVTIKCYGQEKTYTRLDAIKKFAEGVEFCEGSEKERYANILAGLVQGKTYITDGVD